MRLLLCFLLLVMMKLNLHAQQLLILDSTNAPVNAKVEAIKIKDNTKTKGVSENGLFNLPSTGTYQIYIHAIGFQDYHQKITVQKLEPVKIILIGAITIIDDIVVTGELGAKSTKNSVIPVKVIDSKKIAEMGAQNLRDVLTNETGIRISQDNILGSSISMQGVSGENVKILIDGVPIIGRQNGNIDLSQIDMSNVERIEIIEGPMSVNYGTNALGGVINIITKKGNTQKNSLALKTYYESIGTYNSGLTANTHIKKLTIQATASRNMFDGWSASDAYEMLPKVHIADTFRLKTWKPKTQYNTGISLGYKFKLWEFRTKSNYFNELIINRGMPRAPYFEDAFDDTYKTYRLDNSIQTIFTPKAGQSWNTQLSYNYFKRIKNTYYTDLTQLNPQLTSNPEDQDTSKFTLINLRSSYISKYKNLNYEIGTDINIESTTGQRIQKKYQVIGDYALFAVGEIKITENINLRGGLRTAYNSNYRAPILPSFNAKWFVNTKNIIRISYAHGFKAPSLKELYFNFVDFNHNIIGNPNLQAEKSFNINLQYNYVTMYGKTLFKFETKAFYNRINNLITLAQLNGLNYTYVNIGVFKTQGMQMNADIAFSNIKITTGVNYIGRSNDLINSGTNSNKFSYSPEFNATFSYGLPKYKTQFNIFYKFNGMVPTYVLDENKNVQVQNIAAYQWADASVTKTFYKNISIGAGIKNLFNIQNIQTTSQSGFHQTGNLMPIGAGRFYFFNFNYLLQK